MKLNQHIAMSATGLVFNPDTGESFSVNPIGIEILNYLREGMSLTEIISKVTEKYHVDRATIEKDLDDFLLVLKNYSLLEYGE